MHADRVEVGERLAANEIIIKTPSELLASWKDICLAILWAIMSLCILEGFLAILWGLAAYGVEAWAAEEGVLEVVAKDPLAPCGTAAVQSDTS